VNGDGFENLVLSEVVHSALTLAATGREAGSALQTGPVLDALARVDHLGDWSRFWLNAGRAEDIGLADVPDIEVPPPAGTVAMPVKTWRGVALSSAMAESMTLLVRLADGYEMIPVPPGALALALVSVQSGGASQTLLAAGNATHEEFLRIIESDLLGTDLDGLDEVLGAVDIRGEEPRRRVVGTALSAAEALAGGRAPDDLDLLQIIVRDEAVTKVFARAGLDLPEFAEIAGQARVLGTKPAADIVATAAEDVGDAIPTDVQVMITATAHPSIGMLHALRVFGIRGPELAADAAMDQAEIKGRVEPSTALYISTILNVIALFAVCGLIIVHAVGPGSLWELLLIWLAFTGPPSSSTLASFAVSILYLPIAGPLVAGAKLSETLISCWRSRAERRQLLSTTGIKLTERGHSRLVRRRRPRASAVLAVQNAGFSTIRMRMFERLVRKAVRRGLQPADAPE
jgi:hypothetical protein